MDILQLSTKKKSNEGAFLHLQHPGTKAYLYEGGDESKPVGLYVLGKDSDKFEQNRHKSLNDRLTDKKPKTTTSEKIEQDGVSLLADLTVNWENLSIGKDTNFSRENIVTLYTQMPWVKEAVDLFVADRANFI